MGENDYKKLENYLNDVCVGLRINDSFFLDNISLISYLADSYLKCFENRRIKSEEKINNLTYNEIFSLTKEVLTTINPNYAEMFDQAIQNGILDLNYEHEYDQSHFVNFNNGISLININRVFSYSDVLLVVHEFMHYTNGNQDKESINRHLLTEFISIYFEMYAAQYLKNEKNVDTINFNDRIIDSLNCAGTISNLSIPLIIFEKFGSINADSLKTFNSYFGKIDASSFENICRNLLKKFQSIDQKYQYDIKYEKNFDYKEYIEKLSSVYAAYKHFLGTILAIYALYYCDINEIVKLNNHINSDELAKKNIIDILKMIKINISEPDLDKKIANCVQKYVEDNNIITKTR